MQGGAHIKPLISLSSFQHDETIKCLELTEFFNIASHHRATPIHLKGRLRVTMAQLKPYKGGYYIWHYVPSQAAGIVFAVAFALLTAAAMWRMFHTRTWYCSVFVIGGLCKFQLPSVSPAES